MQAVYINLDRSVDRREWMEEQAGQLGIALKRFPAVDGKRLKTNPFPHVPAGAVGCFLSHRSVWSEIAKGDDEYVLVLEDDVYLSADFPKFLDDRSWVPADADLIHLEASMGHCLTTGRSYPALARRLWRSAGRLQGTGTYLISRACARKLEADFTSIDTDFDQNLLNGGRPDLVIYKLLPALSIQGVFLPHSQLKSLMERLPSAPKSKVTLGIKIFRESKRIVRQIAELLNLTTTRRRRVEFV